MCPPDNPAVRSSSHQRSDGGGWEIFGTETSCVPFAAVKEADESTETRLKTVESRLIKSTQRRLNISGNAVRGTGEGGPDPTSGARSSHRSLGHFFCNHRNEIQMQPRISSVFPGCHASLCLEHEPAAQTRGEERGMNPIFNSSFYC
ncbi:hypothetical protein EYF80_061706 [Liparis tanakae]|uniref:Uncharacterized protein n=1 Tax=Liparis tanakae TaxID=230148 RepID=A0A4Z2EH09_9TELE|nr:hypothetical protein EYF80_061706 [Liparis tanakae]